MNHGSNKSLFVILGVLAAYIKSPAVVQKLRRDVGMIKDNLNKNHIRRNIIFLRSKSTDIQKKEKGVIQTKRDE